MTSMTATAARKQLYSLLDDLADSHEPVQITGKRHSGVLVTEADWRAMQETLFLTGVPGMRASILRGLKTPVEQCAKELDW
jgi:PHD/YefM family antitoxin component YafN of YafNO toxin-antitoxin module